jgi:porphobilinogen deaminase
MSIDEMLPCVGQGALGIEIRENDPAMETICAALDDSDTHACCLAERAFLHAMGGGCQSPVGAYAELEGDTMHLRAISFRDAQVRQAEATGTRQEAIELGRRVARHCKGVSPDN